MKKYILILMLFSTPILTFSQVLLETLDGDEITLNPYGVKNSNIIGNLNSSEQSLQFRTLFALPNKNGVVPISFFTLGLKGKPSDGIYTVFSGGNFNPSTNINLGFTKIYLFSDKDKVDSKFIDFFTVKGEYIVNKLTLFKSDTTFKSQINNINFQGGGLSFNYNALFSGKNLFSFSIGYLAKNNYSKLESLEIRDYLTVIDTVSGTFREYGKVVNGKSGDYKEIESFPIRLAYTYCPSEIEDDMDKLKFGFSIYYSSEFGNFVPSHNFGTLFFLTKQNDKSGVRAPIIGLGIQANDLSDNMNKGNKVTQRISINLTTTFSITSL